MRSCIGMRDSSVRSIKKSIILILTGLSSLIAQQPPSRVVFFGRSILSDHDKRQFLTLLSANAQPLAFVSPPFLRTTQYDSPIDDKYKTIRPERSLLINNCDGFCDDPALAFTSVVTVAASGLGNSSASLVPKHWFDLASDAIPAFWQRFPPIWDGRLPTDPFQLLAVVNRLDFAKSSCSTRKPEEVCWTGAELHMVYGSKDGGPFNVIVELVLPPLNWTSLSALALRWFSLQDLTTPNQMRTSLETLIKDEAKSLQSARVRSNSSTGGGNSPWFLTQWTLSSTGIQQVSLDDEIRRECTSHTGSYTTIGVGCEQSENPQCQRYPQLFQKVQSIAVQGGQSYEIAPNYGELLVRSECYANGHKNTTFEGMDGPKGSCSADNSVNSPEGAVSLARNILSLQQCSFCHGAESNNTNFRAHPQPRRGQHDSRSVEFSDRRYSER